MVLARWWASLVVTELQACSFVGGLTNVIFWRPFSGTFQFTQTRILCSLIWCWLWCSGSRGVEGSWGHTILGCRSLCLQLFPPFSISETPLVGCWSSSTDPLILIFCCPSLCLVILLPRTFPHLLFSNPFAEIFILALTIFNLPGFFSHHYLCSF